MSWQLFTLIQVGVFAVAAIVALLLRNRGLYRRNDQLLSLCSQAHEELVNVTSKLSEMETTATPEQLLAERAKTLSGDDVVVTLRRLVLENEIQPSPDFTLQISEFLRSDGSATDQDGTGDGAATLSEAELVQHWQSIRHECQQLAMFLVADQPDFLPAVRQLFDVFQPLDQASHIDLPPVQLPHQSVAAAAPGEGEDDLDQAALDALLADVQTAAHGVGATGAGPGESAGDETPVDADPAALDPARTGTG
ncbi:MAG: hypothetical protein RIC56_21680 [Pseudomonadales bacterium]